MLEHPGTSEVEVGEEDEIVMVRVSGEEGLDDNASRINNEELNMEPYASKRTRSPSNNARYF